MGKKPWEIKHLDTLEMRKFGDRKNYTSLELSAHFFGVDDCKSGMDGSMVNHVYYRDKELNQIANYYKKDVITTAQVYLNLMNQHMVARDKIESLA